MLIKLPDINITFIGNLIHTYNSKIVEKTIEYGTKTAPLYLCSFMENNDFFITSFPGLL